MTKFVDRHALLLRRGLGALVVWQVAYLALTNLWGLFPALPPEVIRYELGEDLDGESLVGRDGLAAVMDRWGELTGTWQGWALFAPNVPTTSAFLAVELHWNAPDNTAPDGDALPDDSSAELSQPRTVKLLSDFEPTDLAHYWLPAFGDVRLYNYEWRLAASASAFDRPQGAAPEDEQLAGQRELLRQLMRRESKQVLAFLRMRMSRWLNEHPGQPMPAAVVLLGRTFAPAPPGQLPWSWQPVVESPLVRWTPAAGSVTDPATLELFDCVEQRFIPLGSIPEPLVSGVSTKTATDARKNNDANSESICGVVMTKQTPQFWRNPEGTEDFRLERRRDSSADRSFDPQSESLLAQAENLLVRRHDGF